MTLTVDRRGVLAGDSRPKLHAFVVGVSDYVHLPLPGRAGGPLGLTKLESAARSAFLVAGWLERNADRLPAALASVRLLVSPSLAETQADPALRAHASRRPDRVTFIQTAHAWRADMAPQDIAFFFFAGHGVQRADHHDDTALLLDNFGQPGDGLTAGLVEAKHVGDFLAMWRNPATAARQIFVFDCCREYTGELEERGTSFCQSGAKKGRDVRDTVTFHSSLPGQRAFAIPGDQSLFCRAFLAALSGAAARPAKMDIAGNVPWVVTPSYLHEVLLEHWTFLTGGSTIDLDIAQHVTLDQRVRETMVLASHPDAPTSDLEVSVDPQSAVATTSVVLENVTRGSHHPLPQPLVPHPHVARLASGLYRATVQAGHGGQLRASSQHLLALPPRTPLKVPV